MTYVTDCRTCGGPGVFIGSLGIAQWYRCRDCGADYRVEPEPEDEPLAEVLAEVLYGLDEGVVYSQTQECRCGFVHPV